MKPCETLKQRLLALRAMGPDEYTQRIAASLQLQEDCLTNGCSSEFVHAVIVEAHTNIQLGQFEKSLERLYAILPKAEQIQDERAIINTKKLAAEALLQIGNFTDALELFFDVLPLAENNTDKRLPASIYLSLGRAYIVHGDSADGLKYCRLALEQFKELDFLEGVHGALINIGIAYIQLEDYQKAQTQLESAISSLQNTNYPHQQAYALGLLGTVHTQLENYTFAHNVLQEALDIATKLGDRYSQSDILSHVGTLYLAQGKAEQALEVCSQSLELAQSSNYKKLLCKNYGLRAEIYEALGQLPKALDSLKEFHTIEREMLNSDSKNISNSMRLRFEGEKAARDAEIQRLRNVELVELNKKLKTANTDLSQSNATLNNMNAEKSLFMHSLKHDLLNPLKHVIFYAEELDDGFDHFSNSQMLEYIRSVKQQSIDLHRMVESLLSVSLIELGEFTIERSKVDILACLQERLEQWQTSAGKKEIHVRAQLPAQQILVEAHPTHLIQIVDNLLSNAIKFSPFCSTVDVHLFRSEQFARLEIRDSGPGLSSDEQQDLFKLFKRLGPLPTAGEKSHGIGLAFVQRICSAMGGRVWYQSEARSGACFVVELALAKDQ